jgi:hypothetical protein
VSPADFAVRGNVFQIGLPPYRIDLLTAIDGVEFEAAWQDRVPFLYERVHAAALSLATLVTNKLASGRTKDLADIEALERANEPRA